MLALENEATGKAAARYSEIQSLSRTHIREGSDEVVDVGVFRSGNDLVHVHITTVVTIADVLPDTAVEQAGLL